MEKLFRVSKKASAWGIVLSLLGLGVALHQIRKVTGDTYCLFCSNESYFINMFDSVRFWTQTFWYFQPMTLLAVSFTLMALCVVGEKKLEPKLSKNT